MFSIKVTKSNQRYFLGKNGKPNVYKTRKSAEIAKKKIPSKYDSKITTSIPVLEI